jgi:RND family efflux transporter MFP subunit
MKIPRSALIALGAVIVVGGPLAWYLAPDAKAAGAEAVTAKVKSGDFKVVVTTTGELHARKFVEIQGPANAQQANVYQMKISSIVPEGTVVKAGDVVAELDKSAVAGRLSDVTLAVQKATAQYTQAQLDSTLTLSQARENMRTLDFALEEKKIAKEQATYEAPSIRRQADIDYEKATRAVAQAKSDYKTKTQQAMAKMSEVGADMQRSQTQLKTVQDVMGAFTIHAPAAGMVIYQKEWNGKKKVAGSQVSPWDPTVATLPDLSQMESVTYVNEIDVRKLAVGQPVTISLDADQSKHLTGKVTAVANVGEQRPNSDAKVFEVKILVEQADTTLRPGMTTANAVLAATVARALYVPLEAVTSENGVAYVFKKAKAGRIVRQEVETGTMNENEIIVVRGLTRGDEVLLVVPPDAAKLETARLPGAPKLAPIKDAAPTTPVPAAAAAAPPGAGAVAAAAIPR